MHAHPKQQSNRLTHPIVVLLAAFVAAVALVGSAGLASPASADDPRLPYPDAAHVVPGVIEAENYDSSKPGEAFSDADPGNHNGAYRNDDVDIWPTAGEDGFTVGRTRGGEWLEYTIDVAEPGTFNVGVRLATGFTDPRTITVSVDGTAIGTIGDVPVNGWWSFSTLSAGDVFLAAGEHVLRLDIGGNGQINVDRFEITPGEPLATITVAAGEDFVQNGLALIDAVTEAASLGPTAANRIVISLAAGTYDLADATITLPDGVDIIGDGPDATTICGCRAVPTDTFQFESANSNRISSIRFTGTTRTVFINTGGDLVVDNASIVRWDLDVISDVVVADVVAGSFSLIDSNVRVAEKSAIVATGAASVSIVNSTLRGGGTYSSRTLLEIGNGRLDIDGSTLYMQGNGRTLHAFGDADVTITESELTYRGYAAGDRLIDLSNGGTLTVRDSTLAAEDSIEFSGTRAGKAVYTTGANVIIADSQVSGNISITEGSLELSEVDFDVVFNSSPLLIGQIYLWNTSATMTGGTMILPVSAAPGTSFVTRTGFFLEDGATLVFNGVAVENLTADLSEDSTCTSRNQLVVPGCNVSLVDDLQTPYPAGAHPVPGVIEAENYDTAPQAGISYADDDAGNLNGAYRSDDVDIWPTVGEDGFTVGRTRDGEWLEYTIDVDKAGSYDIGVRLATGFADPGTITVSLDYESIGTLVDVPVNGWWSFSTQQVGSVELDVGEHLLRLDIGDNGQINLDRIEIGSTGCRGLDRQASAGTISGSMQISGGTLSSAPGTPNKYGGINEADYVEYCVTAADAGLYQLDALVTAPDARSDSFYIGVNGAEPITWHITPNTPTPTLRTVEVNREPVQFTLTSGENIVRFHHRETGTKLESFTFVAQ